MHTHTTDVTVAVPTDRLPEFYSWYGAWLGGRVADAEQGVAETEPAVATAWTAEDDELAAALWAKLSRTARALFSTWIDAPEHRFSGDELAELLGQSKGKHAIAGILAWPGKYCTALGRTWPWSWEYPENSTARYWMSTTMATLFAAARAQVDG
ncbi:DUF6416 domain-containing protein [Actinokineospora sp. NBRC 105648]|uniref:DUF6416 domain-containing protein n=1 Tax=Actinokineospora sp. NBRC 105648 TaxID=3032206 RepID=UPI0024A38555|nr:DUF6416 domain-containing protein [Actinokineospora sp. NBRC 105648]GLZ39943.1 hypothetical protein Acsp05_35670 [Actinokineospora sp. NBRC 105648]